MEEFKTIITQIGLAKIANATALGEKVDLKYMAFGDGGGSTPNINEDMTELTNEKFRGEINNVEIIDDTNIKVTKVIPPKAGGFWIREIGIFDTDEDLIAIGTFPATYKPDIEDGATKDIKTEMILTVSNVDSITLKIDPYVVVATLKDLDDLRKELGNLSDLKTEDKSNIVNAINELVDKKQDSFVYGIKIDEKNANPETRVKYTRGATGFIPVRGNDGNVDWGDWKGTWIYEKFRPCVYKDGEVQYYLDKEDLTKKEDGTPAILTGEDGDVMIEIGKMYNRLEKVGDTLKVEVSPIKLDGFSCLAHTNGDKEVDKIYVGKYLGYEQNGKLRSISGVEPTGNKTIGSFRDLAEANGKDYHQVSFYPLVLLQSIMAIMLKSTDTQSALGEGCVGASGFAKTGSTNNRGLMYGTTSKGVQMCFMGIEDFWGNKRWLIDGCKYDDGNIKTATTNFNDDATGYKSVGNYSAGGGYIETVEGTTETGFIPNKRDGGSSTYYCDRGSVRDGRFPAFGGDFSSGSYAGGFFLYSYSASSSASNLGARLFAYGD